MTDLKNGHTLHAAITFLLIVIAAGMSLAALYLLAMRELPESAGLLVGSVVTGWFGMGNIAVGWWFGSTFGSKAKTELLAKDGK